MDRQKLGRPKSKTPIRDKRLSIRVTQKELDKARIICDENNITYIDIFLKGLDNWSRK